MKTSKHDVTDVLRLRELPTVSVVVVAFNSEKTIISTLESIRGQQYDLRAVEVIVTDDASTDRTTELAKSWLDKYGHVFFSTQILAHCRNQGITKNFNSGWAAARAQWIKSIAADDFLLPNCLRSNIYFISKYRSAKFVFSGAQILRDDVLTNEIFEVMPGCPRFFSMGPGEQNRALRFFCELPSVSAFINRDALIAVGYGDERYPMLEDYPLWFKATRLGFSLYYFPEVTCVYRQNAGVSNGERIGNRRYIDSLYAFQRSMIWPCLRGIERIKVCDDCVLYLEKRLGIFLFRNKKNRAYRAFRRASLAFRPFRILQRLGLI